MSHKCDPLSRESAQNASQAVCEVRSLQELTVERLSLILRRAVENDPNFIGLLRVVNTMVRNVSDGLAALCLSSPVLASFQHNHCP